MTAYLIVHRRDITDPETLKRYAEGVDETIEKFGGRPLVRTDNFVTLEGRWHPGERHNDQEPERVTVIAFPDMASLKSWYESEEYSALKKLRQQSAVCDVVAVEGD